MSAEDIAILKALPDNLPESVLTVKQKDEVRRIYREYIKTDNDGYEGNTLWKLEKKESWAGGERIKDHEAKRMLLGHLVYRNELGDLSMVNAVSLFHSALTFRPAFARLTSLMYERI